VSGDKVKTHTLASFESWCKVCLEPLIWLGLPNPLDCLEFTRFKDDFENQRRDFVKYLAYRFPEEQYFKAAAIKKAVEDDALMNENEGPQLLDYLKSMASFGSKDINLVSLSKFITKLEDIRVGDLTLVRRQNATGSSAWKVIKLC
jgi:hypothetical protein